jgi:hypothetical protein
VPANPAELPKGNGIPLVEHVILPSFEIRGVVQSLKCPRREPRDELELLIAGQGDVLAAEVEHSFNQLEDITQIFPILTINEMGVQHSVGDANKGGALRNIELAKNGRGYGDTASLAPTASEKVPQDGLLLTGEIFEERPIYQGRFEELTIRA